MHLLLQSIVLPQACLNLFAPIIIPKEQDIQEQVLASLQAIYPRFHPKDVHSYFAIKIQ